MKQKKPRQFQSDLSRKAWVVQITKIIGKMLLTPYFRLDVNGLENLPKETAFVLLPKHQRWEDIPMLALATPRRLFYIAKYELFKNPLGRWFIQSLGGIPLNRKRPLASRRFLLAAIDVLENGEGVVLFPEGTYYRNKMGPGQVGIVKFILSRLSLPFVPVGINYTRNRRHFLVRINFGAAFFAEPGVTASVFVGQLMREIAALSGFALQTGNIGLTIE
jgi:1-acyl-sn-glycerol-3-phosphate acyltransferase